MSIEQCDAVEWLRKQSDESADLVLTDPAYESLEKHRAKGTTTRLKHSKASSNDWFPIFPNSRFPELFAEFWRVLKRDRHLYCFADTETMLLLIPIAKATGFTVWNDLTWDKVTMGMGYHYRRQSEKILFFEKGKRKLDDLGISDVIQAKRVVGGYPTEKPEKPVEVVMRNSTNLGERVIDPFIGGGTTAIVADRLGREFAGCDISEHAVRYATERRKSSLWSIRKEHSNGQEEEGA